MAVVQRAHCRHQANGTVLFAADFARDGTHALAAVDNLHTEKGVKIQKPEIRTFLK
jgi:hypothetical protein